MRVRTVATVRPLVVRCFNVRMRAAAVKASSPEVHSSRKITDALVTSSSATLTRRRSPPLMPRSALAPPMRLCCTRRRSTSVRTVFTAASMSVPRGRRRVALNVTASRTVSTSSSSSSCATKPTRRQSVDAADGDSGGPASRRMQPLALRRPRERRRGSSPARMFSSVLLPLPEGPMMPVSSPRRRVRDTLRSRSAGGGRPPPVSRRARRRRAPQRGCTSHARFS